MLVIKEARIRVFVSTFRILFCLFLDIPRSSFLVELSKKEKKKEGFAEILAFNFGKNCCEANFSFSYLLFLKNNKTI